MSLAEIDAGPPVGADGTITFAEFEAWLLAEEEAAVKELGDAMAGIVERHLERFVAGVVTAAGDPAAFDGMAAEWRVVAKNTSQDRFGKTYLSGGLFAYVSNPGAKAIPVSRAEQWLRVVNVKAVAYQEEAFNRIVGATDDVWTAVKERTVKALNDGVEIPKLRREVQDVTGYARSRAQAIARTETLGAYNGGDMEGAVALGEYGPVEKSWLATTDKRTRPSHVAAAGQTVKMTADFDVGGTSMFRPHAPGSPASEVVNCRCVMLMLYPGDTRPDGSKVPGAEPVKQSVVETRAVTEPKVAKTTTRPPYDPKAGDPKAMYRNPPDGSTRYMAQEVRQFVEAQDGRPVYFKGGVHSEGSMAEMKEAVAYRLPNGTTVIDEISTGDAMDAAKGELSAYAPGGFRHEQVWRVVKENSPDWKEGMNPLATMRFSLKANPSDAYWAREYKRPNFRSAATGGVDSSGGVVTVYNGNMVSGGTLRHETGHVIEFSSSKLNGVRRLTQTDKWDSAMRTDAVTSAKFNRPTVKFDSAFISDSHGVDLGDRAGISSYGKSSPAEDLAEAYRMYQYDRQRKGIGYDAVADKPIRFADVFPHRAKLMKDMEAAFVK